MITTAQSGIFVNGGRKARISRNIIQNIDAIDGIDIQGTASGFFSDSIIEGNSISNPGPIAQQGCGIYEATGTGVSNNTIVNNSVNDAFCGVAYVTGETFHAGASLNTLYPAFNSDLPDSPPPPTEPSAIRNGGVESSLRGLQRRVLPSDFAGLANQPGCCRTTRNQAAIEFENAQFVSRHFASGGIVVNEFTLGFERIPITLICPFTGV